MSNELGVECAQVKTHEKDWSSILFCLHWLVDKSLHHNHNIHMLHIATCSLERTTLVVRIRPPEMWFTEK